MSDPGTLTAAGGGATVPRPVTPVSILAARLADLADRANAEGPADGSFAAEVAALAALAGGLDPYVGSVTSPESAALRDLAEQTNAADWSREVVAGERPFLEREMLSGHVEGRLLAMLVHLARARRVLEIGLFTGYSALAMAEALPDDGSLVACELDPEAAEFARACFARSPGGDRIEVRVGPAARTLEQLADAGERFDLVFVDADKAGYAGYLDTLLERGLLADGGVVCVDNTLLQGEPWSTAPSSNGAAIAAFNARVAADPRVEQVLVPVRDGLTLVRQV